MGSLKYSFIPFPLLDGLRQVLKNETSLKYAIINRDVRKNKKAVMKKGYPSTVVTGNESKIQSVVFEVPDFQDGEKGKIISTTETLSFHLHVFKSWVYVEVAGKVL